MENRSIKNWATDDRPREKLIAKGTEALSSAELLAILINNGTRDKSAVQVCMDLMAAVNNNLHQLGRMGVKEILQLKVKGIGEAKAISIVAALELGQRREATDRKKEKVLSSSDIAHFLKAKLQYKNKEVFAVVFLNRANVIKHYEIISEGGITGTVADPRVILKKALEQEATSIILSHNHPSGNVKPSRSDEDITRKIVAAAKLLDITVMDHIIVSDEGYYSFADEGML